MNNQGDIFLAVNPTHNGKLKHVNICYHFIHKYVESKQVNIVYISTNDIIVDIFIKPLGPTKFKHFWIGLGLTNGNIVTDFSLDAR